MVINDDTANCSLISPYFLEKYDLIDKTPSKYFINQFSTVGFADPFPNDDQNIIGSFPITEVQMHDPKTRVYPSSRMEMGNSPLCIWIPNKEILLKLMRACIQVKFVDDLWIKKEKPITYDN